MPCVQNVVAATTRTPRDSTEREASMSTRRTLNGGFEIDWQQRVIDAEKELDEWKTICRNRDATINKQGEEWVRLKTELDALQAAKQQAEREVDSWKMQVLTVEDALRTSEQKARALESACEELVAEGTPHGRNSHYPDGCECGLCEAILKIARLLSNTQPPSQNAKG